MTDNKNYVSNNDAQNAFAGELKIKYLKEKIIAICVVLVLIISGIIWLNSSKGSKKQEEISLKVENGNLPKEPKSIDKKLETPIIVEDSKVDATLDVTNNEWLNIISNEDLSFIKNAVSKVIQINESLNSDAYDYNLSFKFTDLVNMKKLPISSNELLDFKKVKSTQGGEDGIFSYDYFACKFVIKNNKMFFNKTSGSQRKSGFLYKKDEQSFVFLGGTSINDDPLTNYNSDSRTAGILFKISPKKLIMIFTDEKSYEILEIIK